MPSIVQQRHMRDIGFLKLPSEGLLTSAAERLGPEQAAGPCWSSLLTKAISRVPFFSLLPYAFPIFPNSALI